MDEYKIKNEIEHLFNNYKKLFDDETNESINHYLNHDEYEMAFEGLFIEIMKTNVWISKKSILFYIDIGIQLSLDKESVFEQDFWKKLNNWCAKIK